MEVKPASRAERLVAREMTFYVRLSWLGQVEAWVIRTTFVGCLHTFLVLSNGYVCLRSAVKAVLKSHYAHVQVFRRGLDDERVKYLYVVDNHVNCKRTPCIHYTDLLSFISDYMSPDDIHGTQVERSMSTLYNRVDKFRTEQPLASVFARVTKMKEEREKYANEYQELVNEIRAVRERRENNAELRDRCRDFQVAHPAFKFDSLLEVPYFG